MGAFFANHSVEIIFGSLYAAIAVIAHLPQPGDPRPFGQKAYSTFYDTARVLANMAAEKNPKLAGASVTVTPATETVITTPTTVVTTPAGPK